MSVITDITLECDSEGCFTRESMDFWDLDDTGDLDHLPPGWTVDEVDDSAHLCPKCTAAALTAPPGQSPGVCQEPRPAAWSSPTAPPAHRCALPAGHPGPHECHRGCMTWGVAAA